MRIYEEMFTALKYLRGTFIYERENNDASYVEPVNFPAAYRRSKRFQLHAARYAGCMFLPAATYPQERANTHFLANCLQPVLLV